MFRTFTQYRIKEKKQNKNNLNNRKKELKRLKTKKKVIKVKANKARRKGFISIYHLIYSNRNPSTSSFDLRYHYSVTSF